MTENSKHYVQVEIPKLPRWLGDVLQTFQTRNYGEFRTGFYEWAVSLSMSKNRDEQKFNYICENEKTIDLAVALGVWEIEE